MELEIQQAHVSIAEVKRTDQHRRFGRIKTKTQTGVIWKDTPISQLETDKFLNKYQSIRKKIDNFTEDYKKMMDFGEDLTPKNPQYMIMCERLKALKGVRRKRGRSSS